VALVSNSVAYPFCGLYVISQPEGNARVVRPRDPCSEYSAKLSVSPDGASVLRTNGTGTEVVDLATGSARKIGTYKHATWSPDGKWLAVFGGGRLALLEATSFRRVRALGRGYDEYPTWSPDSRYLLVGWPLCDSYFFSLSALEVYTGRRSEIKSSHCAVSHQGYFWVSDGACQAWTAGR
jgi:hypothetical protein